MRRFWDEVRVVREGDGHAIHLDARRVRTPAGAPVALPTEALAEAVAGEWRAVEGEIDPVAMPLTRSANAAIDRVVPEREAVADMIAAYGETDLLCYRAPHPPALAARQAEGWDPLLDWAAEALGARLVAGEGVMHVAQDAGALSRLGSEVRAHGPWELAALSELVTLSGSLVIGLAIGRGALAPPEGWRLSRLEEAWNIEQWGEDAEAAARAEQKRRDFEEAARLLSLLR